MEKESFQFSNIFFVESICLFILAGLAWLLNVEVYQSLSVFASVSSIVALLIAPFELWFKKEENEPKGKRKNYIQHQ